MPPGDQSTSSFAVCRLIVGGVVGEDRVGQKGRAAVCGDSYTAGRKSDGTAESIQGILYDGVVAEFERHVIVDRCKDRAATD